FRQYISNYNTLSQEEWDQVEGCLEKKVYLKGDILLESGQICKKLYFLEAGFLRFYLRKDGDPVTKFFTESPYCFTSQRSFANEIPTNDNIEVLQDSVIWEMSKKDAFELLKILNWSEFVRKLIQEVQYYTEQILEEAQNNTAEERYIKMLEESNPILLHTPLKDVASFLGIAPQSLSRIRKKYWAEKQKLT
ncbi:MAG: Crp/Fnr family transcriptional regulator, partial [Bacteroidota bacterium]